MGTGTRPFRCDECFSDEAYRSKELGAIKYSWMQRSQVDVPELRDWARPMYKSPNRKLLLTMRKWHYAVGLAWLKSTGCARI